MLVVADDAGVEAVGVEVPAPVVAAVEALRVPERERVHPAGDALEVAEHDEVEVVPHEAVGVEPPLRLERCQPQVTDEPASVVVVEVDVATVDPAHRHVIGAEVGKVVPARTSHDVS